MFFTGDQETEDQTDNILKISKKQMMELDWTQIGFYNYSGEARGIAFIPIC
ncbi:MAG: hypothetical protein GF329_07545 [Candidatus Lokiarchaeota archaeon]|nr:hypothetical protein [Candidatus Lokiarchaeota archaeon]